MVPGSFFHFSSEACRTLVELFFQSKPKVNLKKKSEREKKIQVNKLINEGMCDRSIQKA